MAEKQKFRELSDDSKEDLRAAYQAIPQMIAKEGQKQWEATSVFIQFAVVLIGSSLVPMFIPDFTEEASAIVGLVISIGGLLASIIWLAFILRYEKIVRYWVLSAREIEEQMSEEIQAFRRGKEFASGNEVLVSGEKVGYKSLERIPERWGLPLIYIAFILLFLSLIALNFSRLCAW